MPSVHAPGTALRKLDFGAWDKRFSSTTAFSDLAGESLSNTIKKIRAWLQDQRPLSNESNLRIQLHLQKIYCEGKRSGAVSEQAARESRVELLTYLKYELTKLHFGKFPTPEIKTVFSRLKTLCSERIDVPDWFLPPYELRSSIRYSTTSTPTIDSKKKTTWRASRAWARRARMGDLNTRKFFVQDMSRWFQLKHPNVEQLLGACHVGERFFLSRECGDSKELWTALIDPTNAWYVYKKKVIVHSMAWQMLYNAALGLQFLHDQGIVHGNLKSNVVIPDGNIVKIRGFFWGQSRNEGRYSTECGSCGELSSFATDIRDFGWCILEAINGPQNLEYNYKDASWEPFKTPWREWRPSNRPANFSDSQWKFLKTLVCEDSQERVTITEVVRLLKVFAHEEKVFGRRRSGARQLPASECECVAEYIVPSKQKPIRLLLDSIKTNLKNCGATSPATPSANMRIFRRLSDVYLEMTRMSMNRIVETNMLAHYCHILERFHDMVTATSRTSSTIVRLASSRAMPESNYELNLDLDQLYTTEGLSPDTRAYSWRTQWNQDQRTQTKLLSSTICEQIQSAQGDGDSNKVQNEYLAYLFFEHGQHHSRYSTAELGDLKRTIEAISQEPASTDQPWFIPPYEVEFDENPFQNGGFGEVYLGRWLDADVVVKKLKQDDAQSRQSFFNEVNIWYQLNHPNVVKLFGACHVNKPFFVCEFAANKQLKTYLEAEVNRSYMWHRLCDAANGLKYLHDRGIVHGDLKCDNILVGTDGLAKLTDFGLSIFKFDANMSTRTTGAVNWVAPEVLKGGRPTFASDVYSFGMCIIEAVSGECPWPSAVRAMIKRKVKRGLMPDRPKRFQDDERLRHTDRAWETVQQMCCSAPEKRLEMDKVVDSMVLLSKDKSRTLRCPQRTTKQPEIP